MAQSEMTIRACPWGLRRLGKWCFGRFNAEVAAAETKIPPRTGILQCAGHATLPSLLDKLGKMRLRAKRMLCEAVQGRPCACRQLQSLLKQEIGQGDPPRLLLDGSTDCPVAAETPHWDGKRRILWLGDEVVKEFRGPARNQERILSAFEEDGWPGGIDDPLPPKGDIDPKYRLGFTIGRLNKHQRRPLIKFYGNGTGRGVCWCLAGAISSSRRATRKRRQKN